MDETLQYKDTIPQILYELIKIYIFKPQIFFQGALSYLVSAISMPHLCNKSATYLNTTKTLGFFNFNEASKE